MKIDFFINETDEDLRKIFVRLRDSNRFDKKAWTEKIVHKASWNENRQEVRRKKLIYDETPNNVTQTINESAEQINAYLYDLKLFLTSKYNEDFSKSLTIEKNWLKDQIKSFNNRVDITETQSSNYYFVNWIEEYIKNPKNIINNKTGKNLSLNTVKSYKSALNKLIEFEEYENKHFRFEELSQSEFYKKFVYFCRNLDMLGENTIGKYIGVIKAFLTIIKDEGYPVNLDFESRNKFAGISEETLEIYLNEDEINKVFELDLSNNPRLDNVRDHFIIGLWTGLRISDFKRLDISNIKEDKIVITTQKTKRKVALGIHPQLRFTLEKRNGQFPNSISDQKFNEYVKEVVKHAGIDELTEGSKLLPIKKHYSGEEVFREVRGIYPKYELVSSHSCRRSFATNLYKAKKLPLLTLMSLTGHKTESQFIDYVKLAPEENAKLMNDYFNNLLSKDNLIAPLKVV